MSDKATGLVSNVADGDLVFREHAKDDASLTTTNCVGDFVNSVLENPDKYDVEDAIANVMDFWRMRVISHKECSTYLNKLYKVRDSGAPIVKGGVSE